MAVDREGGARKRRGAQRALVEALTRIADATTIARQHLDIGKQVMAESDRLRRLQVGEARHHRTSVEIGLLGQGELEIGHLLVDGVERVADPEPHIGRDLVIARAPCVQAASGGTDPVLQARLDIHMNVFERAREREAPRLDLALDALESGTDGGHIVLGQDAGLAQHRRMRERASDILPPQALVEIDGGVDLLHDGVGTRGETPTPHAIAHGGLS